MKAAEDAVDVKRREGLRAAIRTLEVVLEYRYT